MLPDSMNIGVIAENIRSILARLTNLEATVGTIPVGKIPKDYSSTEDVDTGLKWIDGKTIYERVYSGTTGESGTSVMTSRTDLSSLIEIEGHVANPAGNMVNMDDLSMLPRYTSDQGIIYNNSSVSGYQNAPYYAITRFTLTAPVPAETKTKKKTSKKGE